MLVYELFREIRDEEAITRELNRDDDRVSPFSAWSLLSLRTLLSLRPRCSLGTDWAKLSLRTYWA